MNSGTYALIINQAAAGTAGAAFQALFHVPAAFDLVDPGTMDAQLAHLLVLADLGLGKLAVLLYQHPYPQKNKNGCHDGYSRKHEFDEHILIVFRFVCKNNKNY